MRIKQIKIEGKYPTKYYITDDGRVFSELKPIRINKKKGYLRVDLTYEKNGIKARKKFLIHRLVGMYFLEQERQETIDHLNFDITDNRADNLRWLDRSSNSKRKRT